MADLEALGRRYGVSQDAIRVLQEALRRGGGRQAQFSHPDLGGMGQWSAGGMTQVGDMFNTSLRDRVNQLCTALAHDAADAPPSGTGTGPSTHWWPDGLGHPSASGAQNGMRYACFPDARRIAIEEGGRVTVYDSQEHRISGVSQQQSGRQDLAFTSQLGTVRAADLPVVR